MIRITRDLLLHAAALLGTMSSAFTSAVESPAISSELQDLADNAFSAAAPEKHYAAVYNVGEYALALRAHLIRSARHSIDLQTFVWTDDATTRFLFSEMRIAARRGVRVRLLVDHLPPFGNSVEPLAAMVSDHPNIEIRFFKPISKRVIKSPADYTAVALSNLPKLNRRMHNKLFIVDGRIAIVGGRNYETIYFDWDEAFNFKDREIAICGPVSKKMADSFETYWNHEYSVPAIQFTDVSDTLAQWKLHNTDGNGFLVFEKNDFAALREWASQYSLASAIPDGQIFETQNIEYIFDPPVLASRSEIEENSTHLNALESTLRDAKHYILAQTPYLVACKWTKGVVSDILESNPNIEIHFSTNSLAATNSLIVGAAALKQQRVQLNRLKYHVYQFKPYPADRDLFAPRIHTPEILNRQETSRHGKHPRSSLHAKSLVIDGEIAIISTSNFDPRSTYLNTECSVIIHDRALAQAIEENLRRDMAPQNSWVVAERKPTPIIGHLNNLMASLSGSLPILDLWPTPHTSCFELKEGKAPLPRNDPNFYQHYRSVGNFPGCEDPSVSIRTRFLKALFGWATPFMSL